MEFHKWKRFSEGEKSRILATLLDDFDGQSLAHRRE